MFATMIAFSWPGRVQQLYVVFEMLVNGTAMDVVLR